VTRLCIILAALAVIARVRVAVLPGWVVPLPVVLAAVLFIVCATVVAWVALQAPRACVPPAAPQVAGEAGS
jgi:hypothetical protein